MRNDEAGCMDTGVEAAAVASAAWAAGSAWAECGAWAEGSPAGAAADAAALVGGKFVSTRAEGTTDDEEDDNDEAPVDDDDSAAGGGADGIPSIAHASITVSVFVGGTARSPR